ncbi:MAG: hypothetical protein PHV34_13880 [Verrucomicrobiae bacterium]|nr:hypothetical protein [Verrucomicrobiae bacterium]
MKTIIKFIIFFAIVGAIGFFLVRKAAEKYDTMEKSVYPTKKGGGASMAAASLGIMPPGVEQNAKADAAPASSPPSSVPTSSTTAPYICVRDITAYDPAHPAAPIGKFLRNTPLILGAKEPASGKIAVTFQPPGGKPIHALCNPEDLGR